MRWQKIMIICLSSWLYASHFDVLIIGDEISAYYKAPQNWVNLLKKQCSCSIQIYNSSKTGATSKDGYPSLQSFLKKHDSRVAIIELGYNDVINKEKFSNIEKNIDSMVDLLQQHDTKVILVGIELPPNFNTIYRQLFKSTYQRLAHKHDIALVTTEYTADPNLVELDHIQPNSEGHQKISESITPLIDELTCKDK